MLNKKFSSSVFCVALGANMGDANQWLKYADDQMRGDRSTAQIQMDIETPDWKRTLEIQTEIEGKDEALTTILSPAKEEGIKTLRIEKNMWNYFPKLRRKVAVSSSMLLGSWMGSDFTNDDILKASSMSEDYSHEFMSDEKVGETSYKVIVNKAKSDSKVMWPKIVTLASKEDCLPRFHRYYDKQDKLRRTLSLDKVKKFQNHLVLTEWVMKPEDNAKKKTTILYHDIKFDVKFKEGYFSFKTLTGTN